MSGLENELKQVISTGDVQGVQALLTRRAATDHAYEYGQTALHIAALAGHAGVAQVLVAARADPTAETEDNLTPLDIAKSDNEATDILREYMASLERKLDGLKPKEGLSPRVLLRVYDLGTTSITQVFNSWTRSYPALHTGVQVYDREFSFGMTHNNLSGICVTRVGACTDHTFRESLHMGYTAYTWSEVIAIVRSMETEWRGNSYSALRKNCHHFSDEFCRRLVNRSIPTWINDLAGVGRGICSCGPRDGMPPAGSLVGERAFAEGRPPSSTSFGGASSPGGPAEEQSP